MLGRFTLAFTLAAGLAASASAAEFEGVIDSRMAVEGHGEGASGTGRTYVSRTGYRMEMQMAPAAARGGGPGEMKFTTLVLRAKPGVAYLLNEARKTYSEIDTGKTPQQDRDPEKYTVKKLGEERVAGFDCVHAVVTGDRGDEMEVWITKELGSASHFWASQRDGPRSRAALYDALKGAGIDGWPMRWKHRSGNGGGVTWEVTKVERRSVPASMFDLAGYTKTEGGLMGAGAPAQLSPEQQKQMDDAMQRRKEALDRMPPDQRKKVEEMMKSMGR